ncbi:hypothetical protein [Streptomyces sp. NPDC058869]|uniref:hypothetical protein n=1 Tax=Streptomyces sp. NPDC058869 TaxID=3346659 RepID=UPI0036CB0D1D
MTGTYLGWDGRSLKGTVTFTGPGLVTFPESDLFIAGPVVATLDDLGRIVDSDGNIGVRLPATDSPDMNPSGWAYTVKENLTGVTGARTYSMVLPKDTLNNSVDLADVAPADPTTPTYVAVPGPSAYEVAVGEGFSGTEAEWLDSLVGRGAHAFNGSTVPASSLGLDGDTYAQYTTGTKLGVTHTTVTMWAKSGGTWAVSGGGIRGAQWYVNDAATASVDVPLGDLLLRSDSGDLYQRGAPGWELKGNLKGPKGDKGDTGAASTVPGPEGPEGPEGVRGSRIYQGPAGDQPDMLDGDVSVNTTTGVVYWREGGTWVAKLSIIGPEGPEGPQGPKGDPGAGSVNSVNGDLGPDINLDAADVQAVPVASLGAASGVATLDGSGKLTSGQRPSYTASDVGALAVSTKGAANGVASLGADGKVPAEQLPATVSSTPKNVWTPQALGFEAWTCDPYGVANPVAKYLAPQRLYLCGVHITENTTVNRIVMFARGYGGVSTNRYRAGIYRENGTGTGTKVVESASVALTMAGQESGAMPAQNANHIGATPITIASTVLTPGRYWLAWDLVTGGTTDYAFFHVQNESPVATANFFMPNSPWARAWYLNSQSALPATLNQAGATALANHDIPIMALANV